MDRAPRHHHPLSSSPPLSRLFPLFHSITLCIWLGITGSFSRGRSMFAFQILSHLWWTGKLKSGGTSVVFGEGSKTTMGKEARVTLGEDTWPRYVECDANRNLFCWVIVSSFREWIQSLKGFFQEFILLIMKGQNTILASDVWCFPFLFCPLDKRTYLSHKKKT